MNMSTENAAVRFDGEGQTGKTPEVKYDGEDLKIGTEHVDVAINDTPAPDAPTEDDDAEAPAEAEDAAEDDGEE